MQKTPPESGAKKQKKPDTGKQEQNPAVYAFVDGSYNIATKVYGYGGFLIHNGEKEVLQGSGNDAEMASMRNVSGEILGAMAAVERANRVKTSGSDDLLRLHGNRDVGRGSLETEQAGHDRLL